jgi:hypothetical protein
MMNIIKNRFEIFQILVVLASFSRVSLAFAEDADMLLLPKAVQAPVIDGEMDTMWRSVGDSRLLIYYQPIPLDNWFDTYSHFRATWDEQNFYFFIEVFDNVIVSKPFEPSWDRDVVELFFDPDNSKNPPAIGLDDRDEHLIFSFDDMPVSQYVDVTKIKHASKETVVGWNLEVAIPWHELSVVAFEDFYFGFEVYYNDNDDWVTREHFTRWRSTYIQSWENPGSWGTALLIDKQASNTLEIPRTKAGFSIDGAKEQTWLGIPHISQNYYKAFYDGKDPRLLLSNYNDAQFDCRLAWDDTWLYGFVEVFDDDVSNSKQRFQIADGIELYFQHNDAAHHIVFPHSGLPIVESSTIKAESIQYGFQIGDHSTWFLEFAIPLSEIHVSPAVGESFRFEILQNDSDHGDFEHTAYWWSNHSDKNDPATLGVVKLSDPVISKAVDDFARPVENFQLYQNYPNPFNPTTTIRYFTHQNEFITLSVFNMLGQEVVTLVNENQAAGLHSVVWDGRDSNGIRVGSGLYVCQLVVDEASMIRKMILAE